MSRVTGLLGRPIAWSRLAGGRRTRRVRDALLVAAGVTAAVGALRETRPLRVAELKAYDYRVQRLTEPGRADTGIVILAVDDNSLDVYRDVLGRWPWRRDAYVFLLDYLRYAGARAVAFDILLSEPDLTRAFADTALAESIAASGDVVLPVSFQPGGARAAALWERERGRSMNSPALRRHSLAVSGAPPPAWNFSEPPLDLFAEQVRDVGVLNFNPDEDGVSRREPLLYGFRGGAYGTLALALARQVDPLRFGGPATLTSRELRLGPTRIPLDDGRFLLRWRGPYHDGRTGRPTYRVVSAAKVINSYAKVRAGLPPDVPAATLRGKVVFVALTGVGLFEARPTPLAPNDPGVLIHATMLDGLLRGDWLRRASGRANLALVGGTSLAVAAGAGLLGSVWLAGLAALAVLLAVAAATFLALGSGLWLDVASPLLAGGLAYAGTMGVRWVHEGREKLRIRGMFSRYVSPAYVGLLAESGQDLRLGGDRVRLTVLFSDIRGFTSISERLPAEAVVRMLNEYLDAMAEIVFRQGGTLDKFVGDAVMAFWGAPVRVQDHARRAADTALDMLDALARLNARWAAEAGTTQLAIGIGINTGEAIVGNIGSLSRKLDYTAIGDTVNLASRLEGLNKDQKTSIIVSAETRMALGDEYELRPLGAVPVKGKEKPVHIFELLARADRRLSAVATALALALLLPLATSPAQAQDRAQSAPRAPAAERARWTEWLYRPGAWHGSQLVTAATNDPATDSLALLAKADVYSKPPRWRMEVRRVEGGVVASEPTVLVGERGRVVVLTPLGSTPLAEHAAGRDPVVKKLLEAFDTMGEPVGSEERRTVERLAGKIDRVIVRAPAARPEFADALLVGGTAGRAAQGLTQLGIQHLTGGRGTQVVASAGARGVTKVHTAKGDISVTPDAAAVDWVAKQRPGEMQIDRFRRAVDAAADTTKKGGPR